ncbi:MAG: CoB--CoM heterodisulfide reductase iron-sulfur subunit B family protein [Helicobacteraceae bacterium]|jgi:succinate dehydrogenase / fumarate reductase cytochrome b subunit|nr:CoB--CoM heterodisulfide reductase iron-sulfur subunit B family protein [Helicobacteraceae bacterium]
MRAAAPENLKYALFLGCAPHGAAPEARTSLLAVAAKLGIELIEMTDAPCCGGAHLQDYDDFLALAINAKTLAIAEKSNLEIVTICNTCSLVLSEAASRLAKDQALLDRVNKKLAEIDLQYNKGARVKHFLYALRDDYGFHNLPVINPLDKRIAPFYGCHNFRGAGSMDDPFNPRALSDLIKTLGGETANYTLQTSCCGFHAELQAPKTAARLTGEILQEARDSGADCIVTPCPLCQMSFDIGARKASEEMNDSLALPALHLTQLLGIALGISARELGLKRNIIRPNLTD